MEQTQLLPADCRDLGVLVKADDLHRTRLSQPDLPKIFDCEMAQSALMTVMM
jgi:hypothetical protein